MTPSKFKARVYRFYEREGRHALPWRHTTVPYRILVSEVMLQQTQVDRVIPYYTAFLKRFPTLSALAHAPLGDVLRLWQGLGYNRRAKMLHQCAKVVQKERGGRMPQTYEELLELPGIGPYTAGAIMAFAFNRAVPLIETNIRSVYISHFFPERNDVSDSELLPLITATMDTLSPRTWYAALMDYGAHLKRTEGNASRRSVHHTQQSRFKGSDREIRGALLRSLARAPAREATLIARLTFERTRIAKQLQALEAEGLIVRIRGIYRLP